MISIDGSNIFTVMVLRAIQCLYQKCLESPFMLLNRYRWFQNSFQNHSSVIRSDIGWPLNHDIPLYYLNANQTK